MKDSVILWNASIKELGYNQIKVTVESNSGITIYQWDLMVTSPQSGNCSFYTHKNDAVIGFPEFLPDGFFLFDRDTVPGLYKSRIHQFKSYLIPNTLRDFPRCISISNDGKWVSYVDMFSHIIFIVKANGCKKTIVPVTGAEKGFPSICGFYRSSPYGEEIFYMSNRRTIRSIRVSFENDTVYFSQDRVIAQLDNSLIFNPDFYMQYAVAKDQIFGEVSPVINDTIKSRTGYLTIPDGGRGIATSQCVYKWANDQFKLMDGCGHTMSFDGKLALANAGAAGDKDCVPKSHKGFYITSFRRVNDQPIDYFNEHIDKEGTSINWCPPQYRVGNDDFWGWYLGNNPDYVIGRSLSSEKSYAWIIDWKSNIWTPITPLDSNIRIRQTAVHFANVVSGDTFIDSLCLCYVNDNNVDPDFDQFNPFYRVIKPNGGEVFSVGEICTVLVSSVRTGRGGLYLSINSGKFEAMVPGLSRTLDPLVDTLFAFVLPEFITIGTSKIPLNSENYKIVLRDYGAGDRYFDQSDNYFTIKP